MQFNLETAKNRKLISSYGSGFIKIGKQKLETGLIIHESELILNWIETDAKTLKLESFAALLDLQPSILILGTGSRLIFPEPALVAGLFQHGIVLETMDTSAACRTYNLLASDGRSVAAALMII